MRESRDIRFYYKMNIKYSLVELQNKMCYFLQGDNFKIKKKLYLI